MEIYLITKLLKKKYPKSIHAAGGTHVDMCQEECVKHFDSIIVGPGEESFINVIKDYNNNKLLKKYKINVLISDDKSEDDTIKYARKIYSKNKYFYFRHKNLNWVLKLENFFLNSKQYNTIFIKLTSNLTLLA